MNFETNTKSAGATSRPIFGRDELPSAWRMRLSKAIDGAAQRLDKADGVQIGVRIDELFARAAGALHRLAGLAIGCGCTSADPEECDVCADKTKQVRIGPGGGEYTGATMSTGEPDHCRCHGAAAPTPWRPATLVTRGGAFELRQRDDGRFDVRDEGGFVGTIAAAYVRAEVRFTDESAR